MVGLKPRASDMEGEHSTTESSPSPRHHSLPPFVIDALVLFLLTEYELLGVGAMCNSWLSRDVIVQSRCLINTCCAMGPDAHNLGRRGN